MENLQPKLRFPEFKDIYRRKSLGEISKISSGKSKKDEVNNHYPLFGSTGIIGFSTESDYSGERILVARVGANAGYIYKINGIYGVSDNTLMISEVTENIDFMYYQLKQENLNKYIFGSGQPLITGTILKKLVFYIPTLQEQTKIADFLGAVDKQLDILNQKKEKLNTYKKGVMQQLFSQQLRFKDDNGNNYPDWQEKTLGEIGVFLKGKNISKSDISEDGLIECIRYGELYTRYNEIIYNVFSKTNLSKENLIFSKQNDVIIPASGETAIDISTASCVQKDNVALGGDINIFRSNHNGIFLAYYLNNHCKQQIASLAQGSSVIHIYPNHLKILKISIPSLEEQTKIADFLSAIDTQIEAVENQITKTETYKKGLLQQMFV